MNNTGLEHFLGPPDGGSRSSAGVTWWYTDTSYGQIPVYDIFSIRILAKSQYTGNPSIRILAKSQYTGRIRILLRIHAPPGDVQTCTIVSKEFEPTGVGLKSGN